MNASEKPAEVKMVGCEVCLKEIPKAEARAEEVDDYVLYFCGLECYGKWQKKEEEEKKE